MKLINVTSSSVKKITNKELLNMHRRCHQLYVVAKKRNNKNLIKLVQTKHSVLVKEMLSRKMKHSSPLTTSSSLKLISNEVLHLTIVDSYLGVL